MKWMAISFLSIVSSLTWAADPNVLNIYGWSGIIPDAVIQQFEKETHIKVNFSTYDNNEMLYAKLRANKKAGYDLIQPSSYYVDRMRKQNMLEPLDKQQLINFHNINPEFLNHPYDPNNRYSIPLDWGVTGIFVNKDFFSPNSIQKWADLWDAKYQHQLMLLDDSREVFSIALLALGYSPNDTDPKHIEQAYLKLQALMPNVKLFNSDAIISVLIDEDATLGMAWNGDVYKASRENANLNFVYPKEGFVIWIDSFAIPKYAPHLQNAYQFLNFIMRADIAEKTSLLSGYPTANLAAQKRLPEALQNNPVAYPSHKTLKHGQYQSDISDETLSVYEKYWEKLKMGG